LRLSVLDQSPIRDGGTAREALEETIALARVADRLGYHRYWVAEHHNSSAFAGSSPEILIGRLAQETEHIRVGSGGVMLPHYSPLKVAENFRVLETLYPDRIDLGIGRAPGTDGRTSAALQAGPQAYPIDVFPQQLELLRAYLLDAEGNEVFGEGHPLRGIHAMPRGNGYPDIWLLGSSAQTAAFAGAMGLPFCFAQFIVGDGAEEALHAYRTHFQPGAHLSEPCCSIGLSVLCAEREEDVERLSASRKLWGLRFLSGRFGPFPSDEEAWTYPFSNLERAQLAQFDDRGVTGTPDKVCNYFDDLCRRTGADELILVTITYAFEPRVRSYELIAAEMGLKPDTAA